MLRDFYIAAIVVGLVLFCGCSRSLDSAEAEATEIIQNVQGDSDLPKQEQFKEAEFANFLKNAEASPNIGRLEEAVLSVSVDTELNVDLNGSMNRPLDFEKLAAGIQEKYDLQLLDNPMDEVAVLLNLYSSGNDDVIFDLALVLAYGDSTIIDPIKAKTLFEKAAKNGNARALAELGRLYLSSDPQLAMNYFQRAMEAGDPEGAFLLGGGHRLGLFLNSEEETGMVLLETAAEMGHVAAAKTLFQLVVDQNGGGVKNQTESRLELLEAVKKYSKMEGWLRAGSESGNVSDLLFLSQYYRAVNRHDAAREVDLAAAELGSYDALEWVMYYDRDKLLVGEYRERLKKLFLIHANSGANQSGDAMLKLALIEAIDIVDFEGFEAIRTRLQDAVKAGNNRAMVALRHIQKGDETPFFAIGKAMSLNDSEAYEQRYQNKEFLPKNADRADSVPVKLLKTGAPVYPPELFAESLSGQVVVEILIGKDGFVVESRIIESSHPGFEENALQAAEQFQFQPKMVDGKLVGFRARIPFNFNPPE